MLIIVSWKNITSKHIIF